MPELNENMHIGVIVLTQGEYDRLLRESEQLRIIKRYARKAAYSNDLQYFITSMEDQENE